MSSWIERPRDVAIVGAGPAGYHAASLMMFGSHYPSRTMDASRTAIPGLDEDQQRKVYGGTAAARCGIERGVLA